LQKVLGGYFFDSHCRCNKRLERLRRNFINAFVIFVNVYYLINVTRNVEKCCRIPRVKRSIWREDKHFTYILRHVPSSELWTWDWL